MVSVLMPLYNGAEFLEESVGSVIGQTFQEWELIIGVNGHPPGSSVYRMACRFESERVRVLDLTERRGKSETLNRMLTFCQHEIAALLDVDDRWHPEKLERQMECAPRYDVVATNAQYFGDRVDFPTTPLGEIPGSAFMETNPIINSSSLFRKADAHWDSETEVEDYEMWLRLNHEGKTFYNHPEVLTFHRIHASSHFNTRTLDVESLRSRWPAPRVD